MKKINKSYVALGCLVILNVLMMSKLASGNKYISELQQAMGVVNDNHLIVKERKDKLISNLTLGFLDSGKTLDNLDSLLLQKKRPLLVLRIHENNCNDCVSQSLVHINDLLKKKENIPFDVVVSTSYQSINLLMQDFDLKFFPIQIDNTIDLEIDYTSQPYVFLISQEGLVSRVFVPEFDEMELFSAYLQSIVE
ncbi:hypothetical protein [Roseivirga sp.]|uniref:hypothetical protein n=1 Tax=Roseivirga sp. TaxID=1964215 RepID=UPI002B274D14|nr:hypothetical protein [Roseivirga sp.]